MVKYDLFPNVVVPRIDMYAPYLLYIFAEKQFAPLHFVIILPVVVYFKLGHQDQILGKNQFFLDNLLYITY